MRALIQQDFDITEGIDQRKKKQSLLEHSNTVFFYFVRMNYFP